MGVAAGLVGQPDQLEELVTRPRRRSALGSPKATLRPTLRCGKSAPSWGT